MQDLEEFRSHQVLRRKSAKALALLRANALPPGLHLERISNDPSAWSVRIDGRYRLSLDPTAYLPAGSPDWSAGILLLRILDHDDLYKSPR